VKLLLPSLFLVHVSVSKRVMFQMHIGRDYLKNIFIRYFIKYIRYLINSSI